MNFLATDILSDALGLMRVTGSLLLAETYLAPWGVSIPGKDELAALLQIDPNTQGVVFHFVQHGGLSLRGVNGEEKTIQAGELVVGFGGLAHCISQGTPATLVTLEAHLQGTRNRFSSLEKVEVPSTALVCGVFLLRDTYLNPLFTALPGFLHVKRAAPEGVGKLSTIANLLVDEVRRQAHGTAYTIHRLLELLCVEAIRSHMGTPDEMAHSWFRGIQDPVLAKAMYSFHCNPGDTWSVAKLANEVHLSPSRFAARFTAAVGESCMSYVAQWRMNVARHLLHNTDLNVQEVALKVGYQNLPAFSRTFRRYFGISPTVERAYPKLAA